MEYHIFNVRCRPRSAVYDIMMAEPAEKEAKKKQIRYELAEKIE